jgi:protease IV
LAGGRVWTGAEALGRGLVDENGGYRTALARARELAGIAEDAPGVLIKIAPPRGARPAPGEPVREAADAVSSAVSELLVARVWASAPYEISDD